MKDNDPMGCCLGGRLEFEAKLSLRRGVPVPVVDVFETATPLKNAYVDPRVFNSAAPLKPSPGLSDGKSALNRRG